MSDLILFCPSTLTYQYKNNKGATNSGEYPRTNRIMKNLSDAQLETDKPKKQGPMRTTIELGTYVIILAAAAHLRSKVGMGDRSIDDSKYANMIFRSQFLVSDWKWGVPNDLLDNLYPRFLDNLPYLIAMAIAHVLLKRLTDKLGMSRLDFDIAFSVFYSTVLFGLGAFKIVAFLGINYVITQRTRKYRHIATWVVPIALGFANWLNEGYWFSLIHSSLAFLDNYTGTMQRLGLTFNITALRMIVFNIGYIKARENRISQGGSPGAVMTEHEQIEEYHPLSQYNFRTYLGYFTYAPLLMVGPIIAPSVIVYQSERPLPSVNYKRIALYAVRFIFCLLITELILQNMYVLAISQTRAWTNLNLFRSCMVGLVNLCVILLKMLPIVVFCTLWYNVDLNIPAENADGKLNSSGSNDISDKKTKSIE